MDMLEWARKEVELACKNECPDRVNNEWDYGCACYESALKAFESLCSDEHSGMSIQFTKDILSRLIDGKCLTPITEENADWRDTGNPEDVYDYSTYQCMRCTSLFKDVYKDGRVRFTDIRRYVAIDVNTEFTYKSGLITQIMDELFPITLPYMPATTSYRVFTEEFLTDPNNGDFDTKAIFHIITPEGKEVDVNRYFSLDNGRKLEITKEEYEKRKERRVRK